MNDIDQMLNDSAERYFLDLCTRETLDCVEEGHWLPEAWASMGDIGLVSAAVMETEPGEQGLPLSSLGMLARQAGRFNVPLPLVETYLAQRALIRHGIPFDENVPLGVSILATDTAMKLDPSAAGGYIVSGSVARVAWGRHCEGVVVSAITQDGPVLMLLPKGKVSRQQSSLAGEPRDTLEYEKVRIAEECVRPATQEQGRLLFEGALFRCMQMTGALQRALEMTIGYAKEREQFGRPIAKFQVIQHQIAEMAAQVASATAAADAASHASVSNVAFAEVAMAKIRCSEAASLACTIAHQVHGAMGFTHEHSLHLTTRRLLSWREEFGSESYWAAWLGAQLEALSENELWSFVTAPSTHTFS